MLPRHCHDRTHPYHCGEERPTPISPAATVKYNPPEPLPPSITPLAPCLRLAQVLHSINAWELPRHFPETKLDVVAWNHPHLGVEDFRLHKFLMAHFFESLRSSLKHNVRVLFSFTFLVEQTERRRSLTPLPCRASSASALSRARPSDGTSRRRAPKKALISPSRCAGVGRRWGTRTSGRHAPRCVSSCL